MRFLDKHATRDKHLRALGREVKRLRQAQDHAPIIPLAQPYQRGWLKFYVLDERVEHRPDAQLFRTLLAAINRPVYSRDRSFLRPNGQPIVLRPQLIYVREWRELAWPASLQRFFAFGTWRLEDGNWSPTMRRRCICGFKLVFTWWLREDVQPRLITHQRVELPEVRARLDAIERHMRNTQGWERLHGREPWWFVRPGARAAGRATRTLAEQLTLPASD